MCIILEKMRLVFTKKNVVCVSSMENTAENIRDDKRILFVIRIIILPQ